MTARSLVHCFCMFDVLRVIRVIRNLSPSDHLLRPTS
jgi:hypothetical protein